MNVHFEKRGLLRMLKTAPPFSPTLDWNTQSWNVAFAFSPQYAAPPCSVTLFSRNTQSRMVGLLPTTSSPPPIVESGPWASTSPLPLVMVNPSILVSAVSSPTQRMALPFNPRPSSVVARDPPAPRNTMDFPLTLIVSFQIPAATSTRWRFSMARRPWASKSPTPTTEPSSATAA